MVGVLVLLFKTDVLQPEYWFDFSFLFIALLLIAIGIEKIFNQTKLKFISYLVSVLFVLAVLLVSFESTSTSSESSFFRSMTVDEPLKSPVSEISAFVDVGEDDLTVRESTDELFWARFDRYTGKPEYEYSVEGNKAVISVTPSRRRFFGGIVVHTGNDNPDEWRMKFSESAPLDLEVRGDRSYIHLNFSDTPLRSLKLDADDADIYLRIGDLQRLVNVSIEGSDSKLRLRIPRESGLKVEGVRDDDYLRRIGLSESDGAFVSEGYDTLSYHIDVDLDDRYSSLSIEHY